MSLFHTIKKIRGIKSEVKALSRAYMDARTPVTTKLIIAILALIYIVSPVDIAPDILPLLGIADDVMIIPLIMWILLPNNVLDEARTYVTEHTKTKTHTWRNIIISVLIAGVAIALYVALKD